MTRKLIILALFLLFLPYCFMAADNRIDVITVDNRIINPIINEYISSSIDKAQDEKAQCLIIQIDTPGGLLESTRRIVKKIMNSSVPVIVYVAPGGSRAGSAGVFITLASHVAAMAPSTNIGAAHPVNISGKQTTWPQAIKELAKSIRKGAQKQKNPEEAGSEETEPEEADEPMSEKILNDTIAWVTTIAKTRGRNREWAVKAVKESVSITEKEAVANNVVDLVAQDLDDLLKQLDKREVLIAGEKRLINTENARINYIELTTRQKILNTIINPTIAYILMLLGFYGLLFEFTHPGIGFPGIAGFICIILAFYAFQAISVNYAGVILVALGLILFIAEAITPATFGLLTLGGAISMLVGSLMLIGEPAYFYKLSLNVIIPFVVATGGISLFLVSRVIKAHRSRITSGKEGLIGSEATARTRLNPKGKVFCHGEIWNAECTQGAKKNDILEVKEVRGLTLIVQPKQ